MNVIALIPAAGEATRLSPLPCSKEILPLGAIFASDPVPRVVCDHLLDAFAAASVRRVFFVLREGKWDIPAYLSQRPRRDLDFAYMVTPRTPGSPYTLDVAYPFLGDARVALGFPDILFHPVDAFDTMLRRQEQSRADVVLGLFPAPEPQRMDMVRIDGQGNVLEIVIKPSSTTLTETWVTAVWTAAFSQFMHDYLQQVRADVVDKRFPDNHAPREIHVGDVFMAAIAQGMRVSTVSFSGGSCLDVGTPEALDRVLRGETGFLMLSPG
jgi:glucose-1-phosphate thymidylyltransferase